jgi:Tol biopolymer transport system component/DNA-binding winged helix-turn-helix (wHTH) protein
VRGDFRIGDWIVQPKLNRVQSGDQVFHLEPKVMQVLVQLASCPDEVLSKERLILAVWPGTFVSDHVLTRCISEIRRVLNDDARAPRFIQNVPKSGYRLIAPIHYLAESASDVMPETAIGDPPAVSPDSEKLDAGSAPEQGRQLPRSPRSKRLQAVLLIAILAIAIPFAVRSILSHPRQQAKNGAWRTVPFTSYPGSETQPAFSPDGNQIAFVWNEKGGAHNLFVKLIGSETPLRLTSDDGQDLSPAWSPDARSIAFIRRSDLDDGVYIVPAIGGSERKVHRLHRSIDWDAPGLSWSPDGKRLIFPDGESPDAPSAIYSLSLETLEVTPITTPQNSWDGDYSPAFSPDGKRIAFVRGTDAATRNIYVQDSDVATPKQLTFDGRNVFGLAWTNDSSGIVFSSDRGGTISLWKVSILGGAPEHLPVGGDNATNPAISHRGDRLAYSQGSASWNITRIDLKSSHGEATSLLSSTEKDSAAQYSPDGKQIAFQSYRSGSQEIWISRSDGNGLVKLTSFDGPLTGSPSWSPDGALIAFDSRSNGRSHIYVMKVEGGVPLKLTDGDYNDILPSWSQDGKWIYFGSRRSGGWQIWKVAVGNKELRRVTKNGGFSANESLDGKSVYYTKYHMSGLWQGPVDGGEERQILSGPPALFWGYWKVTPAGIYYLGLEKSSVSINFFNFSSSAISQVYSLKRRPTPFAGITVSRDGRWLLYSDEDEFGNNIRLVENFE